MPRSFLFGFVWFCLVDVVFCFVCLFVCLVGWLVVFGLVGCVWVGWLCLGWLVVFGLWPCFKCSGNSGRTSR